MMQILFGEYAEINNEYYKIYNKYDYKIKKSIKVIKIKNTDLDINLVHYTKDNEGRYIIPINDLNITSAFHCKSYCVCNGLDCGVRIEKYNGEYVIMACPSIEDYEIAEKLNFEKIKIGALPQDYIYMKILQAEEVENLRYVKKPLKGYPFNEED